MLRQIEENKEINELLRDWEKEVKLEPELQEEMKREELETSRPKAPTDVK